MRRASAVDANQAEIVAALRGVGATVSPLHGVGGGVPDLLVGYHGRNLLFEVKDGNKPPSRQGLTPDQVEWHDGWKGQVCIVNSVDGALIALGVMARKIPGSETETIKAILAAQGIKIVEV